MGLYIIVADEEAWGHLSGDGRAGVLDSDLSDSTAHVLSVPVVGEPYWLQVEIVKICVWGEAEKGLAVPGLPSPLCPASLPGLWGTKGEQLGAR